MADIVFAPICSNCGLPIYMDIDVEDLDYTKPNVSRYEDKILHHIQISPSICPNCKTHFECVIMPTRLPYEFPDDVTKLCVRPYSIGSNEDILYINKLNIKKD